MTLSPKLKEMRKAAEAAVKANGDDGAWEHVQDREGIQGVGNDYGPVCLHGYLREEDHVWMPYDHAEPFATHIATSNPQAVLELIAAYEAAEAGRMRILTMARNTQFNLDQGAHMDEPQVLRFVADIEKTLGAADD